MRAVVQRVTSSKVSVDGKTVGEIGKGFNVLLGVVEGDTDEQAILLAGKIPAAKGPGKGGRKEHGRHND